MKEHKWAEYLASLPKREVSALSSVSAFNHERAPMSCLKLLDVLEAKNWTNNNAQRNHQRLRGQVLTTHNTQNGTCHHEHIIAKETLLLCGLETTYFR